ncbi:MAG: hypothetical protein R2779_06125 [Crocinitomicaceae bacterium]
MEKRWLLLRKEELRWGGYDIFVSVQGKWTTPQNMDILSTHRMTIFSLLQRLMGNLPILFNRDGGKGGYDLYKVTFWGEDKKPSLQTEDYLLALLCR